MRGLDPQLAMLAALWAAVGYTMVTAGVAKKGLRWRQPRRCPTCGSSPCHCRLKL